MIWFKLALTLFTAVCLARAFDVPSIGFEIYRMQCISRSTGAIFWERFYARAVVIENGHIVGPKLRIPKRIALRIAALPGAKP